MLPTGCIESSSPARGPAVRGLRRVRNRAIWTGPWSRVWPDAHLLSLFAAATEVVKPEGHSSEMAFLYRELIIVTWLRSSCVRCKHSSSPPLSQRLSGAVNSRIASALALKQFCVLHSFYTRQKGRGPDLCQNLTDSVNFQTSAASSHGT